jgi:Tol biopolymer transport system component
VCVSNLCSNPSSTGGTCDETADCVTNNTCSSNVCKLNNGQACTLNSQCLNVCVSNLCSNPSSTGGTCDETADCVTNNTCSSNVCKLNNGQACTLNSQCLNVCVSNLCSNPSSTGGTCDETADCVANNTCSSNVCKRDNGQACTLNSQCLNVCVSNLCSNPSSTGGTCDETADCVTNNTCSSNVCKLNNGQACTLNSQCLNVCVIATCANLSALGGSCDETADCATPNTCVTSVCTAPSGASCSSGYIAFTSRTAEDGTWDGMGALYDNIWKMTLNGTGRTKLSTGFDIFDLTWSPDGQYLVFSTDMNPSRTSWGGSPVSSRNLWRMNADGTGLVSLTKDNKTGCHSKRPAFSPDGTKIVYQSSSDDTSPFNWSGTCDRYNIWLINTDGTNRTLLTHHNSAGTAEWPRFSDDGTKIVFSSELALNKSWGTAIALNVWITDLTGSSYTALTQNTNTSIDSRWPVFSHSGTMVAFMSYTALNGVWDHASWVTQYNLWVVNTNGTNLHHLTGRTGSSFEDLAAPVFTDDDSEILFAMKLAADGLAYNDYCSNIFRAKTDGSGIVALTRNDAGDFVTSYYSDVPVLYPDGTGFVFHSETSLTGSWNGVGTESSNIWRMTVDGSTKAALTLNNANTGLSSYVYNVGAVYCNGP